MAFLGDDSSTVSSDHGTSRKMFYTLIAKLKTFLSAPESARDPQERLSSGPLPRSLNASMILGQLDTSGEKSGEKTWMERLML